MAEGAWEANREPDAALKPLAGDPVGFLTTSEREGKPGITMIERLGPGCALGTDGLQWIVYKARPGAPRILWDGQRWQAIGFIQSSKQALIECIASKGLQLSPRGQDAIKRQDIRIYRWRPPVRAAAPGAEMGAAAGAPGEAAASEGLALGGHPR
jgi:hypothetical protein